MIGMITVVVLTLSLGARCDKEYAAQLSTLILY